MPMTIPDFQSLMVPALKALADRGEAPISSMYMRFARKCLPNRGHSTLTALVSNVRGVTPNGWLLCLGIRRKLAPMFSTG